MYQEVDMIDVNIWDIGKYRGGQYFAKSLFSISISICFPFPHRANEADDAAVPAAIREDLKNC